MVQLPSAHSKWSILFFRKIHVSIFYDCWSGQCHPSLLNQPEPYALLQADKGKIALAGPFGNPVEGGYLIFKNSTAEVIQT